MTSPCCAIAAAYPFISAVRNQGSCGSCVAFAMTSNAEAAVGYALQNMSNTHNLAEQWWVGFAVALLLVQPAFSGTSAKLATNV